MSIVNNVKWVALSQLARIATQITSITVLARLLSPSDYGLLAIALVFTNFATLFRDFGTGSVLIQRASVSDEVTSAIFWLNVGLGASLCLLLMGASPWVADFYDSPALVPVLCLLALSFPLGCYSIVHQSLLERASQFKKIAAIESVAVVLALAAALAAAVAGMGVYSLVLQVLVAAGVQSVLLWRASTWRPSLRPRWEGLGEITRYSGNVSLFHFVNYFARNADKFIIGKLLGASVVGLYNLAYRLMLFPIQNMSLVVSRAVFPLIAQAHQQGIPLADVYLRSLGVIVFGTAPVMAAMFFFRDPTVAVVFGAKWAGVESLLAWLAPTGFIQSILSTTGNVFQATGQAGRMFRYGLASSVLQVLAFWFGIQFGLPGLVQAYLLATVINLLVTMRAILGLVDANIRQLFSCLAFPVIAAISAGLMVSLGDQLLFGPNIHASIGRLLSQYAAFAIVYLAAAAIFVPSKMTVVATMFRRKVAPS